MARHEFFERKDASREEKQAVPTPGVLFRPPRLANLHFEPDGRPARWGLGIGGPGSNPLFKDGEELEDCVYKYFDYCASQSPPRPLTAAGLALAIGFRSREEMMKYAKKGEDFAYVIDMALTVIEEYKNVMLVTTERSPNGLIFDLKNVHGWKDKISTETIHETGDTLAKLLQHLQGSVLRPTTLAQSMAEAVDAEFSNVEPEALPEPEPAPPARIKKYMLSNVIDELI